MIPADYTIQTKRLLLRSPSEADFPYIFSATRYPGFNDGMLWEPPATEAELEAPLARSRQAWQTGEGYAFTLERKEDQAFIGRISIRKEPEPNVWNIGFWTHPEQQKKGYMTEAVAAIIDFGFRELDANRIEACYALWNKASEAVLQRNGMTFVKYIEQGFQKKGEWVAENLYAIERNTQPNVQQAQKGLEEMEQARLRYRRRRPLQILCYVIALAFVLLALQDSLWWWLLSGLFFCLGVYLTIDALSYVQAFKTRLLQERLALDFGAQITYQPDAGISETIVAESTIFSKLDIYQQEGEDWIGGQWQGLAFQLAELRVLGRYRSIGRSHKQEPYFSGLFMLIENTNLAKANLLLIPHRRNLYMDRPFQHAEQNLQEWPKLLSTHMVFTDKQTKITDSEMQNIIFKLQVLSTQWDNAFIAFQQAKLYIARPLSKPFLEPDLQKPVWDERSLNNAMEELRKVLTVIEGLKS